MANKSAARLFRECRVLRANEFVASPIGNLLVQLDVRRILRAAVVDMFQTMATVDPGPETDGSDREAELPNQELFYLIDHISLSCWSLSIFCAWKQQFHADLMGAHDWPPFCAGRDGRLRNILNEATCGDSPSRAGPEMWVCITVRIGRVAHPSVRSPLKYSQQAVLPLERPSSNRSALTRTISAPTQ
jgi:hypothetical protein